MHQNATEITENLTERQLAALPHLLRPGIALCLRRVTPASAAPPSTAGSRTKTSVNASNGSAKRPCASPRPSSRPCPTRPPPFSMTPSMTTTPESASRPPASSWTKPTTPSATRPSTVRSKTSSTPLSSWTTPCGALNSRHGLYPQHETGTGSIHRPWTSSHPLPPDRAAQLATEH